MPYIGEPQRIEIGAGSASPLDILSCGIGQNYLIGQAFTYKQRLFWIEHWCCLLGNSLLPASIVEQAVIKELLPKFLPNNAI